MQKWDPLKTTKKKKKKKKKLKQQFLITNLKSEQSLAKIEETKKFEEYFKELEKKIINEERKVKYQEEQENKY